MPTSNSQILPAIPNGTTGQELIDALNDRLRRIGRSPLQTTIPPVTKPVTPVVPVPPPTPSTPFPERPLSDFKAVGNGTHDDTAAVQAAFTWACNAAGGPVPKGFALFGNPGTYKITSTIIISNVYGLRFRGGMSCEFVWAGDATKPMFWVKNCHQADFDGFWISATKAVPLLEGIRISNMGMPVTSSMNAFRNIFVFGTDGGIGTCFRDGGPGSVDGNNDFMYFENVYCTDYSGAGWTIENTQADSWMMVNCQAVADKIGNYAVSGGSVIANLLASPNDFTQPVWTPTSGAITQLTDGFSYSASAYPTIQQITGTPAAGKTVTLTVDLMVDTPSVGQIVVGSSGSSTGGALSGLALTTAWQTFTFTVTMTAGTGNLTVYLAGAYIPSATGRTHIRNLILHVGLTDQGTKANFLWYGGFVGGNLLSDFFINPPSSASLQYVIRDLNAEESNRFLITGLPQAGGCRVTLENIRFAQFGGDYGPGLNADGVVIHFSYAGPFIMKNCQWGEAVYPSVVYPNLKMIWDVQGTIPPNMGVFPFMYILGSTFFTNLTTHAEIFDTGGGRSSKAVLFVHGCVAGHEDLAGTYFSYDNIGRIFFNDPVIISLANSTVNSLLQLLNPTATLGNDWRVVIGGPSNYEGYLMFGRGDFGTDFDFAIRPDGNVTLGMNRGLYTLGAGAFATTENGNTGIYTNSGSLLELSSLGPMLFQIASVTKMLLDTNGNVGIGTTGLPAAGLHVAKAAAAVAELLRLQSNTNSAEGNAVRLAFSSQVALDATERVNAAIDALTTGVTGSHFGQMAFSTMLAGALHERMRISEKGEVLIGQTAGDGVTPLQVTGDAKVSGNLTVGGTINGGGGAPSGPAGGELAGTYPNPKLKATTASAAATSALTLTGSMADVPGATVSLVAGVWLVTGVFTFSINSGGNASGGLNVGGTLQTAVATTSTTSSSANTVTATQTWIVTVVGTQTVKLQASIGGLAAGSCVAGNTTINCVKVG